MDELEVEKSEQGEKRCRFCRTPLEHTFVDLGMSPLANAYRKAEDLQKAEKFYPLHVFVCPACFLVQIDEIESPLEIFSEYLYFSSFSESWLEHAAAFARHAVERFKLKSNSRVIEIGSNDGYLLHYFKEAGIGVLGIEPADNVAEVARIKGVESLSRFFSSSLAKELVEEGKKADLLVGNNVIAHIPDTNDLMRGLKTLLNRNGVISLEFPHLLSLIEENQFDTIYHEHYSYFSLFTIERIFNAHGLKLFDADLLNTHGGSLRVYACHAENEKYERSAQVEDILALEEKKGLKQISTYAAFGEKVKKVKRDILKFMIAKKEKGARFAGYGAPAKGNTLLNYCGMGRDFIDYTVDLSPHKQGLYLPGSHIPVLNPARIFETKPDFLLILPWNLRDEIMEQMAEIRRWGGKFVVLIPEIEVLK
ncbi:MAG: class I SAM-dependent methyltransferase [Dethiobacteria bacterium]